jgi:hypothetical protein
MVTGTPAVTFTRDAGRTFAPIAEPLSGIGYTYGLVSLDVPNTLLAFNKMSLLTSTDAGCSWRKIWDLETDQDIFPPTITAARGGRAYLWSDNRPFLARYDSRGVKVLRAPGAIVGLAVNPSFGEELRAGDASGALWHSADGGESWEPAGRLVTSLSTGIYYRFAFNPNNIDHVVAGTGIDGAFVSRDGGRTWQRATGFGAGANNVFQAVFSAPRSTRVWAMGINMAESEANGPSHGRHLYVSDDGGNSYRPVVDEGAGVKLINQPLMVADPRDPNVLLFVFGTFTMGYGTDLFRYDSSTNELTVTHSAFHTINAIAFSPFDPLLMYVGLEFIGSHSGALRSSAHDFVN